MIKKLLLSVVLALWLSVGFAQKITLRPNNEITQWYSFEEWIFSSLNWSYETTDFNTYTAHANNYFNSLEEPLIIFLNGVVYNTKRLNTTYKFVPNFDRDQIDSVVINTDAKTYKGVSTPNGYIDVFIKRKKRTSATSTISLINQVNDPGVLSSTELNTPNVEFITYDYFGSIDIPKFLNTKLIFEYTDFSRTNVLVYDRTIEGSLLNRSYLNGARFWPKNKVYNVLLVNSIEKKEFNLSTILGYTYSYRFYEWIDAAGIEIPSSDKRLQASATLTANKLGVFNNWTINGVVNNPKFVGNTNGQEFGLKESKFQNNLGFTLNRKNHPISMNIGTEWFNWKDSYTSKRTGLLIGNLALQTKWGKNNNESDIIIGTHEFRVSQLVKLENNLDVYFNYALENMHATEYMLDLWNKEIGFKTIDRTKHVVINNSKMVQSHIGVKLNKNLQFNQSSLMITSSVKHYWDYVHPTAEYEFINHYEPYNSILTYSDNKNVGFISTQINYKKIWMAQFETKTSINAFYELYGTNDSKLQSDRRPPIQLSQEFVFKISENSSIETLFRYISSKYYNEYKLIEEAYGWPTVRAEPIYLTYVTSKTYFFDRRASFLISLRNLLNSTENYNTNGQYYNMSIHFSAVINIGK